MSSPVDAADGPRLSIQQGAGGLPVLLISTRDGHVYSIHAMSSLNSSWDNSTLLAQFNGDGFTRVFQLTATMPIGFYRLSVSLRAKPVGLASP